jgi:hypothetical protein
MLVTTTSFATGNDKVKGGNSVVVTPELSSRCHSSNLPTFLGTVGRNNKNWTGN